MAKHIEFKRKIYKLKDCNFYIQPFKLKRLSPQKNKEDMMKYLEENKVPGEKGLLLPYFLKKDYLFPFLHIDENGIENFIIPVKINAPITDRKQNSMKELATMVSKSLPSAKVFVVPFNDPKKFNKEDIINKLKENEK